MYANISKIVTDTARRKHWQDSTGKSSVKFGPYQHIPFVISSTSWASRAFITKELDLQFTHLLVELASARRQGKDFFSLRVKLPTICYHSV